MERTGEEGYKADLNRNFNFLAESMTDFSAETIHKHWRLEMLYFLIF